MLIHGAIVKTLLNKYNIKIKGVLHIGAHEGEEKEIYTTYFNIPEQSIVWVDGNKEKVDELKQKGFQNVFEAVLDETERTVEFHITDNTQASSLLTLNHYAGFYNSIHIQKSIICTTKKLSTFFKEIKYNPSDYNIWNLDIQGSELHVLRGSKELLSSCDAIYTEVNQEEVYKGCGLIDELDLLLTEYGFKRVMTKWTDMKWGDALYCKVDKNA